MEFLDCRELACPQPVIRCRAAVDGGAAALEVIVDNAPALENVQRFLQSRGFTPAVVQESPQCWRVTAALTAGEGLAAAGEGLAAGAAPSALSPAAESNAGRGAKRGAEEGLGAQTLVLLTTETLGRGDDTLGTKLMESFLATLPELGPRLWRLVLVNGGVQLAARPGPALESLQKLAASGVSILVCGACLGHYGLLEAKAVGETSNMLDIVTSLDLADKVIRP